MKLAVIFLQYDQKKYPKAFEEMCFRVDKISGFEKEYIVVDNSMRFEKEGKFQDVVYINGDNSAWEFSGWDRGLEYIRKNKIDFDVALFVNDAFLANGWTLLDKVAELNLAKIAFEQKVAIGHVDTKGYTMEIFNKDVSSWICSNVFFLPKEIANSLKTLVSVDDLKLNSIIQDEFSGNYFMQNAPLSESYKEMIVKWLTEEWHSKIVIKKENLTFFRKKVQAIMNESLLTARIIEQGYKVVSYFEIRDEYELNKKGKRSYFYGLYKSKIKKYIPKKVFIFTNLFLDLRHKFVESFVFKIFKKYLNLAGLAIEEYKITGIVGLAFAIKRHFKKRKGKLLLKYPAKNDYKKNKVTVAIMIQENPKFLEPCLKSIFRNQDNYQIEVIVGCTVNIQKETLKICKSYKKKVQVIKFKKCFFSKNYNTLVKMAASGEYLIFLNGAVNVPVRWIEELINPLKDKKIGAIGAKILDKNGKILHSGIEFDKNNEPIIRTSDEQKNDCMTLVPAISSACMAVRHDVFDSFLFEDDTLKDKFIDIDLCLRLKEAGFDILYNPKVEVVYLKEKYSIDYGYENIENTSLSNYYIEKIRRISNQRVAFEFNRYKNAIVVIRDDGLGDILMGLSAFNSLRKNNINKKIIFLTYERNVEMMKGFGIFDEVLPIPNGKKYSPLPIPTIGTKIFDFIDMEMHFGNFFATAKEINKENRHATFMREFGLQDSYEIMKMPEYPEAKAKVAEIIKKMGYSLEDNFVVFNLTASNHARSWWYPYYQDLATAVRKMGFVPLIVGTHGGEYFKKDVVNIVGKTKTITEYIEAVKLGKYVISTDTSAYHVAALSGIPFLAIFTGGVLPEARLSFYSKYEVVSPPKTLACYPCWDEGCKDLSIRHKKDPCRLIIRPEDVAKKFKTLIQKYPVQ